MAWPRTQLTKPLTIDQQAEILATHLDERYAGQRGGSVKVAESMWHLWEDLLSASNEPRIVVVCTGETPRGSFAEQDMWATVDRQWSVAIVRGHGFRNLEPGEEGDPPGVETLNSGIEAVREFVREVNTVSEEFPINYKGWEPLPAVARPGTANVFTAGAVLRFSTCNFIPAMQSATVV